MKKHIIASIAFALISTVLIFGQNKVYWVHGLNDNASTWNTYKSALIERENQGYSIKWYSSSSLERAAGQLNSWINYEVKPSDEAIVFGHSAGGLVARQAAQSNNKIRAIITAGTPNNGAGIVTSLRDKSFNNVAAKAISKVETNLVIGTNAIGSLFPGIGNAIAVAISGASGLAAEVGKALADNAIDKEKNDYSTVAANDMNPDLTKNNFLNKLNSATPTIPIINLYGNEDDNRLVRIAGTALHKEENDSQANTSDQCFDQTAFSYYNGAIATCITFESLHYAAGTATAAIGFWIPYYWASSALNFTAAGLWTSARRFIQYDIHNEWDSIIGATHTERIEKWHKFLWKRWCNVSYVTVYENSDGFIPNKSSIMAGENVQNIEIPGVNHLEMNSHPLMRQRLDNILNTTGYGERFCYHN